MLIREGIANGELPGWTDAPALAAAYVTFLDGLLLWRLEQGDAYRREDAERRALALLRPILASAAVAEPPGRAHGAGPSLEHHGEGRQAPAVLGLLTRGQAWCPGAACSARRPAARLRSRDAARHDRARARGARSARVHPPARAHPDRAVARAGPLGLLGAHARRARDPRRAAAVPRGRRERPRGPHGARGRPRSRLAQADRRAERPPRRDGRRLVSRRLLPARGDDRPAVGRLARRGARRRRDRRGGGERDPDRDHRRDRDGQAVADAGRGAGPPGGGARLPPDRARDHDARGDVGRRRGAADGVRGGGRRSRVASSSATPTATRSSTTTCR